MKKISLSRLIRFYPWLKLFFFRLGFAGMGFGAGHPFVKFKKRIGDKDVLPVDITH